MPTITERGNALGNPEDQYVQYILKNLSRNFYDRLLFAGIIDEKAKLVHFQKGEASFLLPLERQNALDVQISLVFALAKQFEDFGGPLAHTVLTFADCEVIIMDILADSVLYVICAAGAADVVDMLSKLIEEKPASQGERRNAKSQKEFVEDEWSGQ